MRVPHCLSCGIVPLGWTSILSDKLSPGGCNLVYSGAPRLPVAEPMRPVWSRCVRIPVPFSKSADAGLLAAAQLVHDILMGSVTSILFSSINFALAL